MFSSVEDEVPVSRTPSSLGLVMCLAGTFGLAGMPAAQVPAEPKAVNSGIASPLSSDHVLSEPSLLAAENAPVAGVVASATRPLDLTAINLAEYGDVEGPR